MKEVEVKILEIDPATLEKTLLKLGAKKTFSGLVNVRYFDKNGEIKKKKDVLRVRQFGADKDGKPEKVEVCYKTNKHVENGYKVCDEYHLDGRDFDESVGFFENLGFEITCSYEKKRTVFKYKNLEVVIDEYPQIPPFIEIEGEDEVAIEKLIFDLGVAENERSSKSIGGLLKEKYPHVQLDGLTF
jgi:adenylate cyclase class 2